MGKFRIRTTHLALFLLAAICLAVCNLTYIHHHQRRINSIATLTHDASVNGSIIASRSSVPDGSERDENTDCLRMGIFDVPTNVIDDYLTAPPECGEITTTRPIRRVYRKYRGPLYPPLLTHLEAARASLAKLRSGLGNGAGISSKHGIALVVEGSLDWETSTKLWRHWSPPGGNYTLRRWAELYLPREWAVVQLHYDLEHPVAKYMRRQAQAASCLHATLPRRHAIPGTAAVLYSLRGLLMMEQRFRNQTDGTWSRGLASAKGDHASPLEEVFSALGQHAYMAVPPLFVEKLPQSGKTPMLYGKIASRVQQKSMLQNAEFAAKLIMNGAETSTSMCPPGPGPRQHAHRQSGRLQQRRQGRVREVRKAVVQQQEILTNRNKAALGEKKLLPLPWEIDHVQMAENLLQSRQRQSQGAELHAGLASAGQERTCNHVRRVFKVKLRGEDADSCTTRCKRPDSSTPGPAARLPCQLCLQKHLITLASDSHSSFHNHNNTRAGIYTADTQRLLPGRELSLPRFKSCAVVGHGRHLASSGCGHEIDAHEAIFRTSCHPAMNDASGDVGNRTDFDVWNGFARRAFLRGDPYCITGGEESPRPLAARERPRVVLLNQGDTHDYLHLVSMRRSQSLASVLPILPVRLESRGRPVFDALGLPTMKKPTSGWSAVMYAIRLCQEVALYGFTTAPEAGGLRAWDGHGITEEHKVWQFLDGQEVEVLLE